MQPEARPRIKTIASYTGPRAFEPRARAALRSLGYEIVPATVRGRFDEASWLPALRVVDERHLDRIPDREQDPDTPVVLLTGSRPAVCDDPRVTGSARRPARVTELYRLFQEALEDVPRRVPRAPTHLAARCLRADHRWVGAVVSLSENGCLFRTSEDVRRGMRLNVQFGLPEHGLVAARAECAYAEDATAGLVFCDTPPETRRQIDAFVTQRLAAL